jgi:nucleotide-binding universal stress UspA family protein
MKKILLPTDFSENSWNAISYALKLFEDDLCTFYLLHTYTPIVYHVEYAMVSSAQFEMADLIREQAIKDLKKLEKRIQETFNNPNHHFITKAVFNTLTLEIAEQVEENQIDYVIMGTKGATGAKEVLFGSNTVHVFKHVKCPVLAVPDNFKLESSLEILFPTDYEIDYTIKQVKPIIELAKKENSKVHILNVSYGKDLTEEQKNNMSRLGSLFKSITSNFHSVKNQEITKAISDFQTGTKIDLLVMINNKHSFFENLFFKSTINQIGFHLNIPFLVIPSKTKK